MYEPILHVFAVLQQHLVIIYTLVHQLHVIVGADTIDMTLRRIDVVEMAAAAAVLMLVLKALQVHHQHRNVQRKPIMLPPITQIITIVIINDQHRHQIIE